MAEAWSDTCSLPSTQVSLSVGFCSCQIVIFAMGCGGLNLQPLLLILGTLLSHSVPTLLVGKVLKWMEHSLCQLPECSGVSHLPPSMPESLFVLRVEGKFMESRARKCKYQKARSIVSSLGATVLQQLGQSLSAYLETF